MGSGSDGGAAEEEEEEDDEEEDILAAYPQSLAPRFDRALAGGAEVDGGSARPKVGGKRTRRAAAAGSTKSKSKSKSKGKKGDKPSKASAEGGSPSSSATPAPRRSRAAAPLRRRRPIPWRGAYRALLCAGLAPVTDPALALVPASQQVLREAKTGEGAGGQDEQQQQQQEGAGNKAKPTRRSAPAGSTARRLLRRKWQDALQGDAGAGERHQEHRGRALRLRLRLGEAVDRLTAKVATPAKNAGFGLGGLGAFEASRRLRESGGASLGAAEQGRVVLDGADRAAFLALAGTAANNHKAAQAGAAGARVGRALAELKVAAGLGLGEVEPRDEDEEEEEMAGKARGSASSEERAAGVSLSRSTRALLRAVDRVLPGEPQDVSAEALWRAKEAGNKEVLQQGWAAVPEAEKAELQAEARRRSNRRIVAAVAKALCRPLRVTVRLDEGHAFEEQELEQEQKGGTWRARGAAMEGDSDEDEDEGEAPSRPVQRRLELDTRGKEERLSSYISSAMQSAEQQQQKRRGQQQKGAAVLPSGATGSGSAPAAYGLGARAHASKVEAGPRRPGEELGALGLPVALLRTCGPVRRGGAPMVLPTAAGFKRVSQHLSRVQLTFVPDLTVAQAVEEYARVFGRKGSGAGAGVPRSQEELAEGMDRLAASIQGRLVVGCQYVTRVSAGGAAPEPEGLLSLALQQGALLSSSSSSSSSSEGGGASSVAADTPVPASRHQQQEDVGEEEESTGTPVAMRLDFGQGKAAGSPSSGGALQTPPTRAQRRSRGSAVARRQALAVHAAGGAQLPSSQQSDGLIGQAFLTPTKGAGAGAAAGGASRKSPGSSGRARAGRRMARTIRG